MKREQASTMLWCLMAEMLWMGTILFTSLSLEHFLHRVQHATMADVQVISPDVIYCDRVQGFKRLILKGIGFPCHERPIVHRHKMPRMQVLFISFVWTILATLSSLWLLRNSYRWPVALGWNAGALSISTYVSLGQFRFTEELAYMMSIAAVAFAIWLGVAIQIDRSRAMKRLRRQQDAEQAAGRSPAAQSSATSEAPTGPSSPQHEHEQRVHHQYPYPYTRAPTNLHPPNNMEMEYSQRPIQHPLHGRPPTEPRMEDYVRDAILRDYAAHYLCPKN